MITHHDIVTYTDHGKSQAMDFKTVTTDLMERGADIGEIAAWLGTSRASVRTARLAPTSPSHRRPPKDWMFKLAEFAHMRGRDFSQLGKTLEQLDIEQAIEIPDPNDARIWKVRLAGGVHARAVAVEGDSIAMAGPRRLTFSAPDGERRELIWELGERPELMSEAELRQALRQSQPVPNGQRAQGGQQVIMAENFISDAVSAANAFKRKWVEDGRPGDAIFFADYWQGSERLFVQRVTTAAPGGSLVLLECLDVDGEPVTVIAAPTNVHLEFRGATAAEVPEGVQSIGFV